ncbi:MAG: ubiquinone/menaquinone biosynthesis methyltransferase [Candidatus Accumulibacter adjunctus]|uniref:Ubiquinone/menaquinone biosynthesis methyltransferase n=1 Tax=Candidatus Accumulibacter adjunctus TaxID=1454001 RepID=A0A011NUC6_9PROT|nr:MAG: ubiquinone/menaquinone biosynthesis methyltransferase [Candidatus Accumulibacter adjunctus]
MSDSESTQIGDYRTSHIERGENYDRNLAKDPFDAYMCDMERVHLQRILPQLFPDGIARYLDFACGTARITHTVAPFARETIGVDLSPSMLAAARQRCPGVRFVEADLTRAAIDLGTFDLATAFRFFGNAQPTLRQQVLQVLADLVRPEGYLVLNNHRNPRSLAALFHRLTGGKPEMDLTHHALQQLLAKHGFQVVNSLPIGAWLYRSRMLGQVRTVDGGSLRREAMFGHRFLAPVAPDTILVARRRA